jgi:hypothetical protein
MIINFMNQFNRKESYNFFAKILNFFLFQMRTAQRIQPFVPFSFEMKMLKNVVLKPKIIQKPPS